MAWLSEQKQNAEVNRLIGMLRNSDISKRNAAARQLIQLGANAAPGLVAALGNKEQVLNSLLQQILVRIGSDAIPVLSQALHEGMSIIQQEAASILGEIGDSTTLPVLLEALPSENYKLQMAAALALGKIGDQHALPQLLNTLSDSDPDVRIAVATAIGQFRMPNTYLNLADLLDDPEINVRQVVAQILGETGDPIVIPYLVDALYDSFWWYGREQAIEVLLNAIRNFGKQAFEPLSQAMSAKEPTVRRHVISLLAALKDPRSLEPLQMAFYDPNYDVAEIAAKVLIDFGQTAMPIFVEALASPNDWIREQAIVAIAAIGGDNAVSAIINMLNDTAQPVRVATLKALGQLKDARAIPALNEIASDRSDKEASRLARQAIAAIHAG